MPRQFRSKRYKDLHFAPLRRPYEGTDVAAGTMQAYLDWEYGLVEQLGRDATDGFFVI
jgi:hypothetical protein